MRTKPPDNSKWMRGPRHPNWKGGLTPQRQREYETKEYKDFVKAVLRRDNYTCQDCGHKNGSGTDIHLQVHHLQSYAEHPELRFKVENGITLCRKCHNKTKVGKRRPARIDQELVGKQCVKCGKLFKKRNPRKFCDECKVTKCEYCGKQFTLPNGKRTQRFCSMECRSRWDSHHKCGEDNPHWKGYTERSCQDCGNPIKRRDNEILTNYNKRKFCSLGCAYDYRKKPNPVAPIEIF